jgi:hypothetical protein
MTDDKEKLEARLSRIRVALEQNPTSADLNREKEAIMSQLTAIRSKEKDQTVVGKPSGFSTSYQGALRDPKSPRSKYNQPVSTYRRTWMDSMSVRKCAGRLLECLLK